MDRIDSFRLHRRARVRRARALRLIARRAMRALRAWLVDFGEIGLANAPRSLPFVDR
jgi:hypothetical protein